MENMFCKNCGKEICENAHFCVNCGALVNEMKIQPKFYKAGFVLGILSLCIPYYGVILGIIGLIFGIISKRRSSIIMSIIGIVFWLAITVLLIVFTTKLANSGMLGNYSGILDNNLSIY